MASIAPSVSINASHESQLLETAYQIGRYIQEQADATDKYANKKSGANHAGHFCFGPNPYYDQTEKGLVLEMYYTMPSRIHTPYGRWTVLGSSLSDYKKVMKVIEAPLGLKLLREKCQSRMMGEIGPFYTITKWKDQVIEEPVYREQKDYISYAEVKKIWENFTLTHQLSEE